jgi:hypothetical protein
MLVRPHNGRIEHDPVQLGGLQGLERPFPHAFLGQAAEALADRIVLAEAFGQPARIIHMIALKKRRLSLAVTPQSVTLPESRGAIATH